VMPRESPAGRLGEPRIAQEVLVLGRRHPWTGTSGLRKTRVHRRLPGEKMVRWRNGRRIRPGMLSRP